MRPINFPEANFVFKGKDDGSIIDLPVMKTDIGAYSCWKLTPEDVKQIIETGVLWVGVYGGFHPPVLLTSGTPPEVVMERHAKDLPPDMRMRIEDAS